MLRYKFEIIFQIGVLKMIKAVKKSRGGGGRGIIIILYKYRNRNIFLIYGISYIDF